jgi:hypothetical protein
MTEDMKFWNAMFLLFCWSMIPVWACYKSEKKRASAGIVPRHASPYGYEFDAAVDLTSAFLWIFAVTIVDAILYFSINGWNLFLRELFNG